MKVSMAPRFQAAVCMSRTARMAASSEGFAGEAMEEREVAAAEINTARAVRRAMRDFAGILCSSRVGRMWICSFQKAGNTPALGNSSLERLSVNRARDNRGGLAGPNYGDLYGRVTAIGTDGLLPRAAAAGKLCEVEHVYISVHSRDLLRSDGSVRRLQLASWAAADHRHRANR